MSVSDGMPGGSGMASEQSRDDSPGPGSSKKLPQAWAQLGFRLEWDDHAMRTLHGVSGAFALPVLAGLWCLALLCGCEPSAQSPADGSRFDKAQAKFETQKDLPPSAKTLYSMADILATQGKDKECEFVLRRCVSQYPEFTPAYNSLAELQMRQGRVHEAIATLSKALETPPEGPCAAEQPRHVLPDPQGVRQGAGPIHPSPGA